MWTCYWLGFTRDIVHDNDNKDIPLILITSSHEYCSWIWPFLWYIYLYQNQIKHWWGLHSWPQGHVSIPDYVQPWIWSLLWDIVSTIDKSVDNPAQGTEKNHHYLLHKSLFSLTKSLSIYLGLCNMSLFKSTVSVRKDNWENFS